MKAVEEDDPAVRDQLERDFSEEILKRAYGNWQHLRHGAIALCIAFVLILAQSIVVLSAPK